MSEDPNEITVFLCGKKPDHVCDSDGPQIFTFSDGTVTTERAEAEKSYPDKYCNGGSVTCSKCGLSAMEKGMWHDW